MEEDPSSPFYIPLFLRRPPEPRKIAEPRGTTMRPSSAEQRSMSTRDIRALGDLGYSGDDISNMTRAQGQEIIMRKRRKDVG